MKTIKRRTQFNQEFTFNNYLGMLSQNYQAKIVMNEPFIAGKYYHFSYYEDSAIILVTQVA